MRDKRAAFHSLYQRMKSCFGYAIYKAKRNKVKSKLRAMQLSHVQYLLNKFRSNPKAFYSYVKFKQKVKPVLAP